LGGSASNIRGRRRRGSADVRSKQASNGGGCSEDFKQQMTDREFGGEERSVGGRKAGFWKRERTNCSARSTRGGRFGQTSGEKEKIGGINTRVYLEK